MPLAGVQAMMLAESVKTLGISEVWRRVAATGFPALEISKIPLTPQTRFQIERANEEFGLHVSSLSGVVEPAGRNGNDSLLTDYDKVVADCRALSCSRVRIGMMPLSAVRSADALYEFVASLNSVARRLQDDGITLSYHNHHIEFARIDGSHILDIIRDRAPDVQFEIDVHWVQRGGMDPVRVLRSYAGRVDLVHLKDFRIGIPSDEDFAARAAGDSQHWRQRWATLAQFAELGQGNLDMAAIVNAGSAAGASYFLVEQDQLYGRDVFDCLTDSAQHLRDLGLGEALGLLAQKG